MTSSRSLPPHEEELRLPRTPGSIRRFWARHPLLADVLIALLCLIASAAPAATIDEAPGSSLRYAFVGSLATNIVLGTMIVIACAMLVRRRRWPVAVSVAAYAVAIGYLFLSTPNGGPLLLVTSYSLAVYRSTRAAWIGLGVGLGAFTAISALLGWMGAAPWDNVANGIVGQLVLALIGTLIGANVGGRKRYIEAVIDRSRQLLVERDQQGELAAAAERERIAREMHDIVSHSLTVIVALSEGAAATDDRERAREASTSAAAAARGALTEMRSMLGVLREGDAPLAPAVPVAPHDTVAAAQRAGFPATLTTVGDRQVSPAVAFAVGRIVQEGVTNAMRHAPAARTIGVRVDRSADPVIVEIVNDGVSGASDGSGFGIRGLRERAAHVGGSLESATDGEGRWMLRAELPAGIDEGGGRASGGPARNEPVQNEEERS